MGWTSGGLHMHWTDDEMLSCASVTTSARLGEIRSIHRGARVSRGKDVVHSMAGSTIGNALGSASLSKAVIAVGVGGNAVRGQVVTQCQAFIAVATSTRDHRNSAGVHQRSRLFRTQNQVLPMAIAAHRRSHHAGLHGLSMHTRKICLRNVGVTLPAGGRDIPVIDFGKWILRRKNPVASVTIRAGCGGSVSIGHGSSMHALPVEFHRMREWNLVAREELLVAVTRSASVGQIFLSHWRGRIAQDLNLMHGTVAGAAIWCIRIARCRRFPVNALPEILHFIGMALRALCWRRLGRGRHFVRIAVAGLASSVAERAMNAARHMGGFFGVAGRALYLGYFVGMRKILEGRVAVGAA